MKKTFLTLTIIMIYIGCNAQKSKPKTIIKNKMKVSWHFEDERIYFEMTAPTTGWITIGFNTKSGTTGSYLLMGNIINDKVNLVEHYTESPGNYSPISEFGIKPQVENIEGTQQSKNTTIRFSLPTSSLSKYQKNLSKGKEYYMIMAYSQEDDFQHHSIMRTSVNVKL